MTRPCAPHGFLSMILDCQLPKPTNLFGLPSSNCNIPQQDMCDKNRIILPSSQLASTLEMVCVRVVSALAANLY